MAVPAQVERTFRLPVAPDVAFALLADVPAWAVLFPHVDRAEPLPGTPDAFVWTMDPLGPPGFAHQTVYACRYDFDAEAGTVGWTPIPEVGNARFEGGVALAPAPGGGTEGGLRLRAVLDVPAPRFAAALVRPAVALAIEHATDTFLTRLADALRQRGA